MTYKAEVRRLTARTFEVVATGRFGTTSYGAFNSLDDATAYAALLNEDDSHLDPGRKVHDDLYQGLGGYWHD